MCLILFAYQYHPRYKLIVATNRDEFYKRNTRSAHWWEDHPHILGGRDLQAGGTWMGINRNGRFAALTNYREPGIQIPNAPSRGDLVKDFLTAQQSPETYWETFKPEAFNGYNLLFGNPDELWYSSNRGVEAQKLKPGIYGLSNHLLDTPWPKVKKGKNYLEKFLTSQALKPQAALDFLSDSSLAPDEQLPQTGVPLEWERLLSAMFIQSPEYGTRTSTVILIDKEDQVTFYERGFVPEGSNEFRFKIS